ncbi:MAG: hypothetical protein ACRCUF_18100 [Aeromonas sobria]
MPTFKVAETDQQDTDLKAALCADERHRFEKWCNRLELWMLATVEPDRAHIVAKGLKLRDWFHYFDHGFTASEAIDAEVMKA